MPLQFYTGPRETVFGQDSADNVASTASVTPNRDGSMLERLEDLEDMLGRSTATGSAILANGTTAFTIAGGPIRITDLISYCTTGGDAAASTLQWSADGTVGAATTFTGASSSLTNSIAGALVYCTLVALTTAPVITQTAGVSLSTTGPGIYVPAGIITMVIGGADTTTGLWKHYMRWTPFGSGVSVTAAF